MKPARFIAEAEAETEAAFDWYEARSVGLGRRFLGEVRKTLELVAEAPLSFPVEQGNIRRARILSFPHSIFFRDDAKEIVVFAVFHGRRNPAVRRARERSGA